MELLSECPICKTNKFAPFLKCEDFTVSHETFQLVECPECHLVITNPRPNASEIARYYQSENYISHSNSSKGVSNFIYQTVRKIAIRGKVALIEGLNKNPKIILDYGCGTGEFLNAMKKRGWNCKGIETSTKARQMAINNYALVVNEPKVLPTLHPFEFNVITMWHVLEHVHDLNQTILELNRSLAINGFMIIAIPNREAWDTNYYQQNWAAYDVPRHLYHFSQANVTRFFSNIGFQLKAVKPMFFDPFYIALLSEKYKNGKTNYFNAILNGIRTTRAGKKDITKNSSLIYIFQKVVS